MAKGAVIVLSDSYFLQIAINFVASHLCKNLKLKSISLELLLCTRKMFDRLFSSQQFHLQN